MLTGKYTGTEQAKTGRLAEKGGLSDKFRTPTNVAHVEALTKFAADRGHSLLELAFGWLLAHPPVSSVIAGASSPEQVRSNVAAASWELGDEMLELAKI
jgi:aryl-alcohol dehydrogenase-like predicted oxidoreductase